jgi:hypothetical protein
MRKKHCKISMLVFAVTTVLLFGFFMLATPQAFADQGNKGKGQQKQWQKQQEQETHGRPAYNGPSDYGKYNGYRERPYNKSRHYANYNYKGHRYDYRGHWRSWEQWDGYAKAHPDISRHGIYYRENTHLMFRFCEPGTSNCFFFSIGR